MVLSVKIRIKNSTYYKNKGYVSDINGFIEIDINDLPKKSDIEILAKCDFCEKRKNNKIYKL